MYFAAASTRAMMSLCMWCAVLSWQHVHSTVLPQLTPNFYIHTCPSVERIVKSSMTQSAASSHIALQAVLRLFFHDCFVEGCDASVLVSSRDNTAEKDAPPNHSLAGDGFRAIHEAKANGPTWTVLKGRKDGRVSLASRVQGNLPEANFNVDELKAIFKAKGLNATDMVVLSGAHTLGFAHCNFFSNRLYHYNTTFSVDPTMDSQYAFTLQDRCPLTPSSNSSDHVMNNGTNTVQALDPTSPFSFDNKYYVNLQAGKGLLASDEVLWTDPRTKDMVNTFAQSQATFFAAFGHSMVKLGNVGVKTGIEGDIRKDCSILSV
eukprot:c17610_g1_i1 orf=368-1324(-)